MLRLKDKINLNEGTMAEQEIKPEQEIKHINIKDLVLWTENPRYPVDTVSTDQDIATLAISTDGRSRWNLKTLFKLMGKRYDYSELPIVFYVDDKPVVYDGNRRVLIGKIKYGYVEVDSDYDFSEIDFPEELPCSVCHDKEVVLDNIQRKHAKGGSWKPLERDIFKHKEMKEPKSFFMVLNEATGIISNNLFMNQVFVKEEVFSNEALKALNISGENNKLESPYSDNDLKTILDRIVKLVDNEKITTRENRFGIISLLEQDAEISNIISKNKEKKRQPHTNKPQPNINKESPVTEEKRRRNKSKERTLFGKDTPHFEDDITENLFFDLRHLHSEIIKKKYSEYATMIVAMGLRLLCQVADKKYKRDVKTYIDKYFDAAEMELTDPDKLYLVIHNVRRKNMAQLLNEGAHKNADIISRDQTVALSLIIAKILENTHGK